MRNLWKKKISFLNYIPAQLLANNPWLQFYDSHHTSDPPQQTLRQIPVEGLHRPGSPSALKVSPESRHKSSEHEIQLHVYSDTSTYFPIYTKCIKNENTCVWQVYAQHPFFCSIFSISVHGISTLNLSV